MNQQYMRNPIFETANKILALTIPIDLCHLTVALNLCISMTAMIKTIRVCQFDKSIEEVCINIFIYFLIQYLNSYLSYEYQDICYEIVSPTYDKKAT